MLEQSQIKRGDPRGVRARKWLIPGLILFSLGMCLLWGAEYIKKRAAEREELYRVYAEQVAGRTRELERSAVVNEKRLRVADREDWRMILEKELPRFSAEERASFGPLIRIKAFEADFWKTERMFVLARGFFSQNKDHPAGMKYLADAADIYKRNEELVPNLAESIADPLLRARAHYLVGVWSFRSLLFLSEGEGQKGADLVVQALTHFDKVFAYEPYRLDRDTQVAIEFLQNEAKQFLEAADKAKTGDQDGRLRLLPQGEISVPGGGSAGGGKGRH